MLELGLIDGIKWNTDKLRADSAHVYEEALRIITLHRFSSLVTLRPWELDLVFPQTQSQISAALGACSIFRVFALRNYFAELFWEFILRQTYLRL